MVTVLKIVVFVLVLGLAMVIGGVFFSAGYTMTSTAMEPQIHEGGVVFVNRFSFRTRALKRGEIVLIQVPGEETQLVRRVIAFQRETVDIEDGTVFINGTKLDEPWLKPMGATEPVVEHSSSVSFPQATVGDNRIFVLGDFRKGSRDSREFGDVPMDNVVGTIWTIFGFAL